MRYIEPMNLYRLTVGDRGRVVLPAAARRACGMQDGDDLIVMVGDDGVLTLQRAATLAQKVEAAQAALIDAEATDDLREWRESTDARRADHLENPVVDAALSAERGRHALERLGLV